MIRVMIKATILIWLQFGITNEQVVKGIVSDRNAALDDLKEAAISKPEDEDDVETEEEKAAKVASRTRSGRISRPPKTEMASAKLAAANRPKDTAEDEPPPKRKFTVPERFRCRVCHKIYLGDRKMAKHMRLFPSHGPPHLPQLPTAIAAPPLPPAPPKASEVVTKDGVPQQPVVSLPGGKKLPAFPLPIINMARSQLEELVKNLDAELVLDVVARKMFDSFSMWDLQSRKMSQLADKGVKRLIRLMADMEKMVAECKKLVDDCLTDARLFPEGHEPAADNVVLFGEYMQAALSVHEGPWYLEPPKHIPEKFHTLLDLPPEQLAVVSPRSDFAATAVNHVSTSISGPGVDEEDNSCSLMSAASAEKDSSQGCGVGAPQMVLERNLGVAMQEDEDTQDDKGMNESKQDQSGDEEEEDGEEEEEVDDEDDGGHAGRGQTALAADVDPKRVLEQHGIAVDEEAQLQPPVTSVSLTNVSSAELAKEIDSLGPFPTSTDPPGVSVEPIEHRTPLPSFSSFMGGGQKQDDNLAVVSTASETMPAEILSGQEQRLPRQKLPSGSSTTTEGPMQIVSGPPSVSSPQPATPASVEHQQAARHHSTPASYASSLRHPSGPPSAAESQARASSSAHPSGPPSNDQRALSYVSGPPSVDQHHLASGPPSVDSQQQQHQVLASDICALQMMASSLDQSGSRPTAAISLPPSSPMVADAHWNFHPQIHSVPPQSGPPSYRGGEDSGPPSVASVHEGRLIHHSGPASVDMAAMLHQKERSSLPSSPRSDVVALGAAEGAQSTNPAAIDARRRNSVPVMQRVAPGPSSAPLTSMAAVQPSPIVTSATKSMPLQTSNTSFTTTANIPAVSETIMPSAPPVVSLEESSKDSTGNLLNDLESVLNEAGEFPFSALNEDPEGGGEHLKATPEKAMQAVAPASVMGGNENKKQEPATPSTSEPSTASVPIRTSFIGALSETSSPAVSARASREATPAPPVASEAANAGSFEQAPIAGRELPFPTIQAGNSAQEEAVDELTRILDDGGLPRPPPDPPETT